MSTTPTVEYIEMEPLYLGTQRNMAGEDVPEWLYGAHRVDLGGFVYMSPNWHPHPIDDPEYDAFLVEAAEEARAHYAEPGGGGTF